MAAIIEIREFPANTPDLFLESDGRLLLDLGPEFGFSLSKAPAEGNDLNEIKREGTESFQVPLTPKNRWIFRRWLYPNAAERDFTRLLVYAYDGAHQLPEDRLDVLRINLPDNAVEVGLFESPELGVVDGAKNLYLNTLDFGTFTLNETNLENNWAVPAWDGEDFYFGLVHYGNFVIDLSEVSPEDFRPLLSVLATLERGFCSLGWVFESPLKNCDWFRRLWWYGLGKEYYKHSNWGMLSRVEVETDADINLASNPNTLYFNTETNDPGNNHAVGPGIPFQSVFTQTQPNPGFLNYRLTGQIECNPLSAAQSFFIVFSTSWDPLWKEYPQTVNPGETLDIDIEFIEQFPEGETLNIFISGYEAFALTIKQGMKFTISPTEKYYHRGDVIDIRESIDPNYTFLQFLQGLAHFGIRYDIDQGTRTVTALPPEDVDIFGEGVFEGYFRPADQATDLSEIVLDNSAVYDFPREDIPETLIIGFAKSKDKYIESLEIPEDAPLYSKRLTFATGVRGQVEFSENPFFEPTANFLWFGDAEPQISSPAMWDNDERERSFEIGPRLLYAAGLVEQTEQTTDGVKVKQWSFLGALRSSLPYVFQVPGATIGTPPALPDGYLVYDDATFSVFSIWKMFLQLDNRFYKDLPKIDVLALLANVDYHKFSFRDRVLIPLLGRPTIFKVLAIRDFQTADKIPTPITLQVDPEYEC